MRKKSESLSLCHQPQKNDSNTALGIRSTQLCTTAAVPKCIHYEQVNRRWYPTVSRTVTNIKTKQKTFQKSSGNDDKKLQQKKSVCVQKKSFHSWNRLPPLSSSSCLHTYRLYHNSHCYLSSNGLWSRHL